MCRLRSTKRLRLLPDKGELASVKKRQIAILLACVLLIGMGLFGCIKAEPQRIGIVSAMDNEVALLLKEAKIERVDTFGGVDFHVGTLEGQPVVIMRSGIGKVLSASALTAMLNRYSISRVIFTGIAGGVGDETNVLDQVIATRLVQHDYGTMTNDGFVWETGVTGEAKGEKGFYFCDSELVDLAYECAVQVIGKEHVFKGTIATGDQFIASEAYVKTLQAQFDAIACEMEGASDAAVCAQYEIPFVVIRAMSDKADGNAHDGVENMGDLAADNSSRIVMQMLGAMGKKGNHRYMKKSRRKRSACGDVLSVCYILLCIRSKNASVVLAHE